jgi:type II secretory pathway component PulF
MITLRREFRTRVLPAAIQFVASILIVALLITVIGMTNPSMDVLGIGLRGFSGTMVWLIFWFGGAFAIFLILRLIRKSMGRGAAIDRFVLRIPVVGSCFQSISTARLCTALSITHGTGMSVYKALRLSLDATENHAYAAKHDSMKKDMKAGETLAEAFTRAGVFDPMFCDALHNAEIAGTIAESMEKQAEIYQELASHQLSNLNRAASMAVQAASAAVIVVLIFRIAYVAYIKPLNDAVNMRI